MSKPLAKVTVMVSSTTARHRESTVTTVLPRFRPRLAQAMESRGDPLPRPLSGLPAGFAPFGVAHRLNRGHLCRHPARLAAGQEHRHQGEQGGGRKEDGVDGHNIGHAVQPADHRRGETRPPPASPAAAPPGSPPGRGQGLVADDAPELAAGGADGLEQAVEADVVGDGDLEHVVDDQIASKEDEQQHGGNGGHHLDVQSAGELGTGVAPVDAGADIVPPRRRPRSGTRGRPESAPCPARCGPSRS